MESQLQYPELKNNPENFLPLLVHFFLKWITGRSLKAPFGVAAVDIFKVDRFLRDPIRLGFACSQFTLKFQALFSNEIGITSGSSRFA